MNTLILALAILGVVGYMLGFATTMLWKINNKFTNYLGYNEIVGQKDYRIEDYYG